MTGRLYHFAGAVACGLATMAFAQGGTASPLTGATEAAADKPATLITPVMHADPEIERLLKLLTGSFRAEGAGSGPALRYNAARVTVEGLDNAVYFEVTREDSPLAPFRQGMFHVMHSGKALRLRVMDFRMGRGFGDAVAGLWAVPDVFPALKLDGLAPSMDLVVMTTGEGAVAQTVHAFPTVVGGAVDVTSRVELGEQGIVLQDVGLDASGAEVWGGGEAGRMKFVRQAAPWFTRLELADGLVAIRVTEPDADAPRVVAGGEVAAQYSGWLTDGVRFDSSRQEGRDAFRLRVPGGVIAGWNEGMKGIALGERRKLVIPPQLGYGERARGQIPANATLIFEVECVFVDNSNPAATTPPANPHGGSGH